MSATPDMDRMVVDAVRNVRDRFGAEGLRDLVRLANNELRRTEEAAEQLAAPTASEHPDIGDTQAWMAFTGEDER
ncbi:MAG: hypothetical protein ACOC96_04310 [Actinomycetota bacterium]